MLTTHETIVRPDVKGRVTLGKLTEGVSSFRVTVDNDHRIILEPYSEIPTREKWLFENQKALGKVKQGIEDSAAGKVYDLGSFAAFTEEDED